MQLFLLYVFLYTIFQKFQQNMMERYAQKIEKLQNLGLLEETEDSIRLTRKGLDYANLAFMEFV